MSSRAPNDVLPLTPANGPPPGGSTHEPALVPGRDPISPFVHGVLGLFDGTLSDVRFPDVDRDSLSALAAAAREAQCEVEALEAALEAARARTRGAQELLGEHAGRALAYARVFATGQPELEEALAALRVPAKTEVRETKTASSSGAIEGEGKRRGRPRKHQGEPMLPIDEPGLAPGSERALEASVGAAE